MSFLSVWWGFYEVLCIVLCPSISGDWGHIPISCNNCCSHQGLLTAESCLLAWHPSSACDQGEQKLFFQPHWPDWKALQQNPNGTHADHSRPAQIRVVPFYARIKPESCRLVAFVWAVSPDLCESWIQGVPGWWMVLLYQHQLNQRPWNGKCSNCSPHLLEKWQKSLEKLASRGSESFLCY